MKLCQSFWIYVLLFVYMWVYLFVCTLWNEYFSDIMFILKIGMIWIDYINFVRVLYFLINHVSTLFVMSVILFKECPLLLGGPLLHVWFKWLSFDALFDPGVILCLNYKTKNCLHLRC